MASRGRKSAASLSVVATLPAGRPPPPKDLTDEQAEEWRAVVARMPAGWFTRETHPLLAQFCRHVVRARQIEKTLDEYTKQLLETDEGLDPLDRLAKMADREARAMTTLATKMRLTQQSHYRADKVVKTTDAPKKPWERVTG
jgi:hypothetical protein